MSEIIDDDEVFRIKFAILEISELGLDCGIWILEWDCERLHHKSMLGSQGILEGAELAGCRFRIVFFPAHEQGIDVLVESMSALS